MTLMKLKIVITATTMEDEILFSLKNVDAATLPLLMALCTTVAPQHLLAKPARMTALHALLVGHALKPSASEPAWCDERRVLRCAAHVWRACVDTNDNTLPIQSYEPTLSDALKNIANRIVDHLRSPWSTRILPTLLSALQSHASRFSLIDELDALGAPPSALHAPHVELPPSLDAQLDQSLPPLPPRRWLEMTADFERLGALLRATSASGIDSAPLNGKASSDRASVVDSIDDELGTLVGCASCELQRRAGGEWKRVRLA
eukprot:CAMPEP_0168585190 /NCGR_PEP_ID=MMETSP0420-20121227/3556_1 /TAXON_ID=498008 /ORGANISM="Pessonella sp." /LENGTH=260 /DNA_ID=CAMNT_0008620073 /DNA_START=78 /DNA_END=858 /DNA_ORIENTATION=+